MQRLMIAAALALMASAAEAGETFYDSQGRFAVSAVRTSRNGTSFYGSNGSFNGSSVRIGNTTNYYNNRGSFVGSTRR